MRGWRCAAAMVAATCLPGAPAAAQSSLEEVRDRVRDLTRGGGLGDQLLGLSGFAALPGISAATFDVDGGSDPDADIVRLILPLSKQLDGPTLLGGAP